LLREVLANPFVEEAQKTYSQDQFTTYSEQCKTEERQGSVDRNPSSSISAQWSEAFSLVLAAGVPVFTVLISFPTGLIEMGVELDWVGTMLPATVAVLATAVTAAAHFVVGPEKTPYRRHLDSHHHRVEEVRRALDGFNAEATTPKTRGGPDEQLAIRLRRKLRRTW
jgi:hypothetical protein